MLATLHKGTTITVWAHAQWLGEFNYSIVRTNDVGSYVEHGTVQAKDEAAALAKVKEGLLVHA